MNMYSLNDVFTWRLSKSLIFPDSKWNTLTFPWPKRNIFSLTISWLRDWSWTNGSVNSKRAHPPPDICRAFVIFWKSCKCPKVGPRDLYKNPMVGLWKVCKCPTPGCKCHIYRKSVIIWSKRVKHPSQKVSIVASYNDCKKDLRIRVACIDDIKHEFYIYLASTISQNFSWPFCLNHCLTKKVSFPLSSSNDTLLLFLHVLNDLDVGEATDAKWNTVG